MVREVVVLLWTGAVPVLRLGPDDPDPTVEELDAIATAWSPYNDDAARPAVRVLEKSKLGRPFGVAGSVPF